MPSKLLTEAFVRNHPNPKAGVEYTDKGCRGLRLHIGKSGVKRFEQVARIDGAVHRQKLGAYQTMTLEKARAAVNKRKSAKANGSPIVTVQDLWDHYLEVHGDQRSIDSKVKLWTRYVLPEWADKVCNLLTQDDAFEMLNLVEERSTKNQKKMVLRNANPVFKWAYGEKRWITQNPFDGIVVKVKAKKRDRVLNLQERRKLMAWADNYHFPKGPLIKLLGLTGVRVGEAISMRRSDVKGRVWHVRGQDGRKHGTKLTIPLTDELVDVLKGLPRLHDEYVFAHKPTQHMSWGHDQMNQIRKAMAFDEHWVTHTLRHTFATVAEEAGVPRYVVKYALGHADGTVTEDYSHADHNAAKLACLEAVSAAYTNGLAHEIEAEEEGSIWD